MEDYKDKESLCHSKRVRARKLSVRTSLEKSELENRRSRPLLLLCIRLANHVGKEVNKMPKKPPKKKKKGEEENGGKAAALAKIMAAKKKEAE